MVVAGVVPVPASGAGPAASPTAAVSAPGLTAAVAPAAPVHPAQVSTSVAYNETFGNYTYLPTTVTVVISISGDNVTPSNLSVANASIALTISDQSSAAVCSIITAGILPGTTTYGFVLNPVLLSRTPCPNIATDVVTLQTTFTFTGYPYAGNSTSYAWANTSLIFLPLSASLVSPSGSVGVGNTTFVATYAAQYVQSVRLIVWNPGKTTVLENTSLQWASASIPTSSTWYAPAVGVYPYALTLTTLYGSVTATGNVTVISSGTSGIVFYNSSVYHNSTILGGLNGASAGTLLLVVGLIIGMIVALAVASAMRRSAPEAAQPWQGSQAAAAPNTCSVCGKSFGSADELAAHSKTEHGMS